MNAQPLLLVPLMLLLPDSMTMEEAALMEPTAVAVHSCRRAGVELGKTVLICGAGPIGLVNVVTSLAMGATEVVVTDIDEGRLKVAKSLGATGTYLVKRGKTPQECAEEITHLFTGAGRLPRATPRVPGVGTRAPRVPGN